jgi:hypothetical protein
VNAAYLDTSCLVAIAFGEAGSTALARKLEAYDELFSSNLLEAELRSSFAREGVEMDESMLGYITWILPDRSLSHEITHILRIGYLRGADLWHVASCLYLAGDSRDISFVTLDSRQQSIARQVGFRL